MNASILVVGEESFQTVLVQAIQSTVGATLDLTVEGVSTPNEAVPLIQAQQPDLILLDANQTSSLSLCTQIKAQNHLAWIYCLLVNLQPRQLAEGAEVVVSWSNRLLAETQAMEAGADAYLWMTANIAAIQPEQFAQQNQRLQAQIKVGLRQVQNHRELMRTNDILSAIALSDPLTELNNRRALEWELPRQIHNARSRNMPLSLMMIDVDFFKGVNDTYGHLVGDRALQLIVARLRHNLRFYNTPFRYGGEEFVIILSDTGAREAKAIANRLRSLIASQPFAINATLDLSITISAGTATLLPEDDSRGISLLRRADQNLLRAKAQGRNQVVSCEDNTSSEDDSCEDNPT